MIASVSRRPYLKQIVRDLIFVGLIGICSIALGLLVNALREHPLPLIPVAQDVALAESVGESYSARIEPPTFVELEHAMQAHDDGETVFVDARPNEFFGLGHIAGAISLPRSTFTKDYPAFTSKVQKDRPLMIYCSESKCVDSTVVAQALTRLGYKKVEIFKGGWDEWEVAGQPSDNGDSDHE